LLRKTCGCKRDEVTGYWRRLHSEECHDQSPHQYYSGAKIKNNEMGKGCGTGGGGGVYRVLVGKPEGIRPLERLRHKQ